MAGELEETAPQPATDPASALAAVRTLALDRFPGEQRTLELFFDELTRRLPGAPAAAGKPADFEELLDRLEELLEALLVGQANGLRRA